MSFLADVVRWFTTAGHWQGANGIPHRLSEHLIMSAAAMVAAGAVAVPAGILLGHANRFGALVINMANVGRAVPSFAILVVAVQIVGIGALPAFCALVALAVPPMVTNSFIGIRDVDPDVRESARGMGMNGRQVLGRVELPIAVPLIMAGVRTAAVEVVATATIAALVAWGGLGRYVIDGLAQRDFVQVFAGALLVAGLAVFTEVVLAAMQRLLVPAGLRRQVSDKNETFVATAPVVAA
ncbi:MAG: ABC transporter permease [Actinomycetota bacterium]|nr:ABC transporter permease [Actinomycetota bacterium]